VWPDAYYMSTYEGSTLGALAFDRTRMLEGQTATFQYFSINSLPEFPRRRTNAIAPWRAGSSKVDRLAPSNTTALDRTIPTT